MEPCVLVRSISHLSPRLGFSTKAWLPWAEADTECPGECRRGQCVKRILGLLEKEDEHRDSGLALETRFEITGGVGLPE
jgi:hypothetical protein